MVRRIRSCQACQMRFVAVSNAALCTNCSGHLDIDRSSHNKTSSLSSSSTSVPAATKEADSSVIKIQSVDIENGESDTDSNSLLGGGSEGGDDFHCTQLLLDGDEDVMEDDAAEVNTLGKKGNDCTISTNENCKSGDPDIQNDTVQVARAISPLENKPPLSTSNVYQTGANSSKKHSKPSTNITRTQSGDVCFICGILLSKLKRRLDHIKRCSKRHAITGRDVKANTDIDTIETDEAHLPQTTGKSANPYTRESSWHGDANVTLRMAESSLSAAAPSVTNGAPLVTPRNSVCSSKQTSLTSFVNNPVRNINNVLLAGARRMNKANEVLVASAQQKQKQKQDQASHRFARGKKRGRGSSYQKNNYASRECPMYKKIPGTDFVCDGFHFAKGSLTKNYFLTHFHSDHYGGITRTWDAGIIYCSLPTATLVSEQLGVDKKYLHPLPMDSPTIIASKGKPITVTLLDANHCPGAVMFLFEVGKRNILHVGDFRWNRECMLHLGSPLKAFVSEKSILDDLFLDTTYCDPKYALPPQADTISAIQTLFQEEVDRCKENRTCKTLHLFGAYTIGKERMYLSIAEQYNLKVYVDTRRFRVLSGLNWPKERMALLTTRKEEANIWVVPLGDINMKKLPEYFPQANSKPFATPYDRIVGYRPTGWSMGSKPSSNLVSSRRNGNIVIHSVPYSEHSSFPELVDCLGCLKPQRIVPTVSASKSEEQVKVLLRALREKQTTLPFASVGGR